MLAICHVGVGAFLPCSIYVPVLSSAVSQVFPFLVHVCDYLQYPGFASRSRRRKVFGVGDLLVLVLVIKIVPYLRLSSCQRRLPLG